MHSPLLRRRRCVFSSCLLLFKVARTASRCSHSGSFEIGEAMVDIDSLANNTSYRDARICTSRIIMDVIENLRAYLAVARTGSFSGAARELHVAASVVTKRISQLEWRLKSTLFERTTRRVSLTTAGQQHLIAIQRLVSDLDGIFGSVQQVAPELQ